MPVDPVVGSAGDPQSWNGYSYARNNPLVYVDPTGLYLDKPGDAAPRGDFVCNAACQQRQQQNVMGALLYIAAMNRAAAAWTAASPVSTAMPCGASDPGGSASLTTQVLVIGGSAGLAAAADPVPGDEVAIWLGTGFVAAGTAVCVGANCGGAIYGGIEGAVESLRTLFSSDDGERSIDNPESLEGATPEEIEALIPEGWVKEPTRTGGGVRYFDPRRRGIQVRVMPGDPNVSAPVVKRGPYVRVSIPGASSEHIPLAGNPYLPPPPTRAPGAGQ